MINLKYSLIIEATKDPTFFTFYSPDIEGFTGVGHSVEDCLYQAKWGTEEQYNIDKKKTGMIYCISLKEDFSLFKMNRS